MQENKFDTLNLCSVSIISTTLPDLDIQDLISKIYNLRDNFPSANRSNINGYQTENNLNLLPDFFPLVKIINDLGIELLSNPNLQIVDLWGNLSLFGDYNMPHNHGHGYDKFSGVIYLKVPENGGRIWFYNPLEFGMGVPYSPKEKEVLIFPKGVYHSVEPNLSQEDRISIAFNYG